MKQQMQVFSLDDGAAESQDEAPEATSHHAMPTPINKAARRMDDAVVSVSRLFESSQRVQSDMSRAMESLVSDLNAAAKDQTDVIADLSGRVEKLERSGDTAALKDSIRALGLNVSRIVDQTARDVAAAAGQVDRFARAIEGMDEKLASAKSDSQRIGHFVQDQLSHTVERIRAAEAGVAQIAGLAGKVGELQKNAARIGELEQAIEGLENFGIKTADEFAKLTNAVANLEEQSAERRTEASALSDRVRQTETHAENIAKIEGEITALKDRLTGSGGIAHALSEFEARETASGARVEALHGKLGALTRDFEAVCDASVRSQKDARKDVEALEARIEAALAANLALSGRLGPLETRLANLSDIENSLARLNRQLLEADARGADTAFSLASIHDALRKTSGDIEQLRLSSAKFEKLAPYAEAMLASYPAVKDGLIKLQGFAGELDSRHHAAAGDIAAVKTALQETADAFAAAQSEAGKITERLAAAEAGFAAVPAIEATLAQVLERHKAYDLLEKSVAVLGRRDAEMTSRVGGLTDDLQAWAEEITRQDQEFTIRLNEAEARLANLDGAEERMEALDRRAQAIDGLKDDVAALGRTNDAISRRVESGMNELRDFYNTLYSEQARTAGRFKEAAGLAETQKALEERVETLARRSAVLDRIEDYLTKFEKGDAERSGRLETLTRKIETIESEAEAAWMETEMLAKRMQSAEERMAATDKPAGSLAASDTPAADRIMAQLKRIDEDNAARDAKTEQLFSTLSGNLEGLSKDVAALRDSERFSSAAHDRGTNEVEAALTALRESLTAIENRLTALEQTPSTGEETRVAPPVASQALADVPGKTWAMLRDPVPTAAPDAGDAATRETLQADVEDALRMSGHSGRTRPIMVGTIAGLIVAAAAGLYLMIPRMAFSGVMAAAPAAIGDSQLSSNSVLATTLARAQAGDAGAMLSLATAYSGGAGVERNDDIAAMWFTRAAQAGSAMAQFQLGIAYEKGIGVKADAAEAVRWYLQAANGGNAKSMYNLGVSYANGNGVEKNLAEAARWFGTAASYGVADAQFNLAILYEHGLGVKASLPEAYKWYTIAASSGDADARMRSEAIATQLKPAQRQAADTQVASYQSKPLDPASNAVPLASLSIP